MILPKNEKVYDVIYNLIYTYLDFKNQLKFINICKKFNKYKILSLKYNTFGLTDEILKHNIYLQLKILNTSGNEKITNLNHLTSLEELDITCYYDYGGYNLIESGVGDFGISEIKHNLKKLNACLNNKITNLTNMYLLEELNISGIWRIIDIPMAQNLTKLFAHGNSGIKDLNHLTSLTELDISSNTCYRHSCEIGNIDICRLKLKKLDASGNYNITDLNFMTSLEELIAIDIDSIGNDGIAKLNLKKLDAHDNRNITNLNHMTLLEELNISGRCGVNYAGIKNLLNIIKLDAHDNCNITNLNHMTLLEELNISGRCGVDYAGIKNLLNITKLDAYNNPKITVLKACKFIKLINIYRKCE